MPSKFVNPFEREDFKSWVISLIPDGGKVACSVTYPDGKVLVCGDSQMGLDAFAKKMKETSWVCRATLEFDYRLGLKTRFLPSLYLA